jgi:hypothetical protein
MGGTILRKDMDGRSLSNQPSVGVPLAISNLQNLDLSLEEKYSCLCYLGYRILDKYDITTLKHLSENYSNPDFVFSEIAKSVEETRGDYNQTRWFASLAILNIYIRCIIKNETITEEELEFFDDIDYVKSYPRSFVNIVRMCCMLYATKVRRLKLKSNEPEMLSLLMRIINHYKTAISFYVFHKRYPESTYIVHESHEAIQSIFAIMSLITDRQYSINVWKSHSATESVKYFNQCLLIIFGKRNLIIPG